MCTQNVGPFSCLLLHFFFFQTSDITDSPRHYNIHSSKKQKQNSAIGLKQRVKRHLDLIWLDFIIFHYHPKHKISAPIIITWYPVIFIKDGVVNLDAVPGGGVCLSSPCPLRQFHNPYWWYWSSAIRENSRQFGYQIEW